MDKHYTYTTSCYCIRCGNKLRFRLDSILPTWLDENNDKQWTTNSHCEQCGLVIRLYRTRKHIVQIYQVLQPKGKIIEEDINNDGV